METTNRGTTRWLVPGLLAAAFVAAMACGGGAAGDDDDDAGDAADVEGFFDGTDGTDGTEAEADIPPNCGDGVLDPDEDCDDGNTAAGDGCENDCSFSCEADDECDDGDVCNGDETCSPTHHYCAFGVPEPDGTTCTTSGGESGVCVSGRCVGASCGNGLPESGEECDDGNTTAGDGCDPDCTWSCHSDGECDDFEVCNGDETCGTDHICVDGTPPADGTTCPLGGGVEGVCNAGLCASASCGNATTDPGEECDDGNPENTDGCLSNCRLATCGDGFVRAGHEECDGTAPRGCTTPCGSTGTQPCLACMWADTCTPPSEVCNGLDDNCDGTTDESFECIRGAVLACTTSCGTAGSQTCTASCTRPATCTPPAESCNGVDDDCDTVIDNGFDCTGGATGTCTTACGSAGTRTCSSTTCTWGACAAGTEICNGADDDCDTVIDNGFDCTGSATGPCTTSCGSAGTRACNASTCTWGTACTPPIEVCNGADDDCDGAIDNGFDCVGGATGTCTASCGTTGTRTCVGATCTWGVCVPPGEICNAVDDDCNGATDESFACIQGRPTLCTTTCGSTGTGTCTATCAVPTGAGCTPPVETCNGADDDCDTVRDNGFACVQGSIGTCSSGACAGGTRTCSSTCAWGTCTFPVPRNDTCAGAIPVDEGPATTGTSCGAANDYAGTCGNNAAGPDVMYRLDVAMRSLVTIDLAATGMTVWDPVLVLRSGNTCPGTEVSCNDDIGGGSYNSRLSTTVDAGTYWIQVDGYVGTTTMPSSGPFSLTIDVVPVNDECTGAIPLALGAARTTVTGNTRQASNTATIGCAGGNDVWYVFRLLQREVFFINTFGSAHDTGVGFRTDCGGGAGVPTTCANNTCSTSQEHLAVTLAPGTYYLVVDGAAVTASGAFTLNVEHLPVGSDPTARVLSPGLSTTAGDTWSMVSNGLLAGSCGGGGGGGSPNPNEDTFYFVRCPSSPAGILDASTCSSSTNFDTVLYARTGATGGELACNDDTTGTCGVGIGPRSSAVTTPIPAGAGLYTVYVDGFSGSGNYGLATSVPAL